MSLILRLILVTLSTLLAAYVGNMMWELNEEQQFWGHLPVLLFLGIWFAFWLFFWPMKNWSIRFIARFFKRKIFKLKSAQSLTTFPKLLPEINLRWLALSTLSGVLLAGGFSPFPTTFLMFLAFVPLLIVENEIAQSRPQASKFQVFKYSYNTFVLWNILSTYWVANTSFGPSFVAIWLNAFFMTIPFVLFHQTKKRMNEKMGYTAFITYWLTFEFIHLRWEISWTWLTLGNSFAAQPSWVQWYEFTGVFGGGLWILLANVLMFKLADSFLEKQKPALEYWVRIALLLIVPMVVSQIMYYTHQEKGDAIEVVTVNPNYDPHYEKFKVPKGIQLEHFLTLSEEVLTENTDYLVFPETSFGRVDHNKFSSNSTIKELKAFVNKYSKLKLISGLGTYKIYKPGEEHGPNVRVQARSRNDTIYWESYNSAIQIESASEEIPVYFKSKLVPGAEFLPYANYLTFLKPIVDELDGSISGLGHQELRENFHSDEALAAPIICYESIYGEYCTGYIRHAPQALFIVTNDGWWDNTLGFRQHLQFASLRAIETRRSIARSANIGSCAFVNQRGDILQASPYDQAVAIKGSIQCNDEITFYVKMGDFIGRISLFTCILLLLNTFVKGLMTRKSPPQV